MTYTDETLMACVDGEVDDATRAAVAAAAARDPELAQRLARHNALRERIRAAYDPTLSEPVPERLTAALQHGSATATANPVTELAAARAGRERRAARDRRVARPWPRREWLAVAASVTLGVTVGWLVWHRGPAAAGSDLIAFDQGLPTATGRLAQALSTRLASDAQRDEPVQLRVSFRAKSGEYCRTFTLPAQDGLAGLACRGHDAWRVLTLERRLGPAAVSQDYRMAGSGTTPALIAAIDELIDGDPLDAEGEKAALARDWR